jgi:hypothetical protein
MDSDEACSIGQVVEHILDQLAEQGIDQLVPSRERGCVLCYDNEVWIRQHYQEDRCHACGRWLWPDREPPKL